MAKIDFKKLLTCVSFVFIFSFKIFSSENTYNPTYNNQIKINISFNLFISEKGVSLTPNDNFKNKIIKYQNRSWAEGIRDGILLYVLLPILGTIFGLIPAVPLFAVGGYNCYNYYKTKPEWYIPLFIVGGVCAGLGIISFVPLMVLGFRLISEDYNLNYGDYKERQKEIKENDYLYFYKKGINNLRYYDRDSFKISISKNKFFAPAYICLGVSSFNDYEVSVAFKKAIELNDLRSFFFQLFCSGHYKKNKELDTEYLSKNFENFKDDFFYNDIAGLFLKKITPEELINKYENKVEVLVYIAMYYKTMKSDEKKAKEFFDEFIKRYESIYDKDALGLEYWFSKKESHFLKND